LTAALYAPLLFAFRGVGFARDLMRDSPRGAIGGVAAFGGYALVVWAMTQTTIGAVAALRESSVVFAALIGVVFLGEPFRGARAGAAVLIMAGVVALRLG
jgi:drug/metabolite transporter (DMT)-like permease